MPILKFSDHEASVHRAIVVSIDLIGFSRFCNQPEPAVSATVPKLIKRVFDSLNEMLSDRDEAMVYGFFPPDDNGMPPRPTLNKFTGDGALMIWTRPANEQFPQEFCNLIVQTMRSFQQKLSTLLPAWEDEWRVQKIPKGIRVGIATGLVYALRSPHLNVAGLRIADPCDFVGYCINLAVRLQGYLPELGFLVQGSLHPNLPGMSRYIATGLKGAADEPVAVFNEDVKRVPPDEFARKFTILS